MRLRVKDHPWKSTPAIQSEKTAPKRNKYGAKPAFADGHRFPSTLERDRFRQLKAWHASGEYIVGKGRLVHFALWPKFLLPGGVKAELDSVQVWMDGERVTVEWEDAKGKDPQSSRNKRKQIESIYRIKIQLWPPRP